MLSSYFRPGPCEPQRRALQQTGHRRSESVSEDAALGGGVHSAQDTCPPSANSCPCSRGAS